jgi:hypothetical protein
MPEVAVTSWTTMRHHIIHQIQYLEARALDV